jgi:predicted AlkP superfamily pyrophosphatase or phosphodiesterase
VGDGFFWNVQIDNEIPLQPTQLFSHRFWLQPHYFIVYVSTLAIIAGLGARAFANTHNDKVYKHVVTFSVDGLHGSDVEKYVALRPASTIATLLKTAYENTDCYASAPSDSYPGVAAFVTGSNPRLS